ncbi:MAG: tetratricopeptide repeat protein [Alphaproteobacteria bacterium]|nr:tetratricopeptide repeat protein [Alphaproteobacteria bacterium]
MKECSKSIIRRQSDPNFLNRYFVGDGIDIGGAPDPLSLYREIFPRMGEVQVWDLADGDAQLMAGVPDDSFAFVHSSHCLEHLEDPAEGLANWFRILKPGGHLVVTVPDEDLYEQGVFPSTFNSDHKWTLTIFKHRSWSARSRNLIDMISSLGPAAEIQKIELLTASYRYDLPRFDQTLTPIGEAGIEFVLRKRPAAEVAYGGRQPRAGTVTPDEFTLLTGIRLRRRTAPGVGDPSRDVQVDEALQAGMAEHRAGNLAGAEAKYREVLAALPDDTDALHLLANCLYQRGEHAEAKSAIEKALALKPDASEYYNMLGIVLRGMGDFDGACKALARALRLSPEYPEAHCNLGLTLTDMKQYDKAETVLRMGLTHKPTDPDIHCALGRALVLQGRLKESVAAFDAAQQAEPSHANALNYSGVALGLMGDRDRAEKAFERALDADPNHVDAHCSYGQHLLAGGRFDEGWAHHEWRLRRPDYRRDFDAPRWKGEALDGRTVLVWCEQGLGDAINFIRYVPMVAARGGRVLVECRESLQRLFADVEGVSAVVDVGAAAGYDLHVPLLSLPGVFGTTLDNVPAEVPYVPVPEAAAIEADGAFKVGLVWAGNPNNKRDPYRSRPLADFAPLAAVDGVRLYGLQVDMAPELPPEFAAMTDLAADVRDLYDTAAILAGLDLLITVDTAAAHLAGAMGRPVWMILDKAADWRWLVDRDDTPWYPTMRLFRRSRDWPSLFARVAEELRAFAAA